MENKRPADLTTVTILSIINGIVLLVGGIVSILIVPTLVSTLLSNDMSNLTNTENLSPQFGIALTNAIINVVYVVSSVAIALGLTWFGLAWGLFSGKGWAWLITVIFAIISVVVSIVGVLSGSITSIPTLIINGVILYYMYRPHIKSYFGRVSIPK
ncbi:MAG TPA: DUF2127 domain-containing protein [Nitrososphaeraceae archaeon]|nr:DUF2127 domain-containing protein [Nitrososphaeraceae archaeon]